MGTSSKEPIIEVKNISKQYNIGMDRTYKTFAESFTNILKSPIKSLQSIGYQQDTFWALKDINFDVNRGEVVGIIGRNGAGKSTLLKILSRITTPTEGEIRLRGRVGSLLEVGTGFHPGFTGRENIYFNGAILGMKKKEIDDKFDEIVDFSGVEKFLDTPVKRYSSGMQVRLAFSVAANLEPEILVVDEVLAVGDAQFQKKCLGKMGDVAESGRTVLFVSHNMGAVSSLCDKGILLIDGKIKGIDYIDVIVKQYLASFTSTDESKSLIENPTRLKGFEPILSKLEIETENNTAYLGKPLKLRIAYNAPKKIINPQFFVIFYNFSGTRIFSLNSDWQPNNIHPSIQGEGVVECIIESLPLMPGSYYIGLRLWQVGKKIDDIEIAAKINVEWLDREYGQSNWNSNQGLVYVHASWKEGKD